MKFSKLGFMIATAMFAVGAFAIGTGDLLVSFSTEADTYADGTPVLDGEWYALCWAQDGNFEGLNLDCTPVDSNDKVLVLAPLAKGGRCGNTLFVVKAKDKPTVPGNYFVYLLDTRDVDGAVAERNGNVPAGSLNGSVVSKNYTATASSSSGDVMTSGTVDESATWSESAIVGDLRQPRIVGFKPLPDAKVKIDVADMLPGVKYNVLMGESLDDFNTYGVEPKTGETATFELEAGDAKFFKVVRQPLNVPVQPAE